MELSKKSKEWWWLKYVATLLASTVLMVLSAWHQGAFVIFDKKSLFAVFSNAFFLSGVFTLLVGLPILIKYGDMLEKLVSGLIKFFHLFREDSVDRKYRNFYGYKKKSGKERNINFWLWYINIVGVAFIVIGGALYVAFETV